MFHNWKTMRFLVWWFLCQSTKCFPDLMINTKLEGYSLTFKKLEKKCDTGESLFIILNTVSGVTLSPLTELLEKEDVLNNHCSSCAKINAGVPEGSILVLVSLLIYIKSLGENGVFQWTQNFSTLVHKVPTSEKTMNSTSKTLGISYTEANSK